MELMVIIKEICRSILDEPTGTQDSKSGKENLELLLNTNKEQGTTHIIVTHNPNTAASTKRVLSLLDGLLEEE